MPWTWPTLDATRERWASASAGALLTALAVTPLEVVKVRIQTQLPPESPATAHSPATCAKCADVMLDDGLLERRFPKQMFRCSQHVQFRGAAHALAWIVRCEGVSALYNGLHATLWMSIPATVLYFSAYDELRDRLSRWSGAGPGDWRTAIAAGSLARVVAATVVAPFELVRTRAQAQTRPPGMVTALARELRGGDPLALWRGLSPTLWRDVPFSAVYWVVVERVKASRWAETASPFNVSAAAACAGGVVAAVLTHPFDVVKTRRQVFDLSGTPPPPAAAASSSSLRLRAGAGARVGTFDVLADVVEREGARGVFLGLGPRLAKIVPATVIMLSTYDFGKRFFEARRRRAAGEAP